MQPLETWEELVAGYVLEDLSLEEKKAFDQLLQQRPELIAAEIRRLQETLALTPYALPEAKPSSLLRNQLLEAAQLQTTSLATRPTSPPPRPMAWVYWAGSLAAVAAFVFGLDSYRLRQELKVAQAQLFEQRSIISMLHQPNTRLVAFKSSAPSSQASGNLVITPEDKEAVLTLKNVAPLPKGQMYRLWAIVNGKKVACGQFVPNLEGTVFLKLPMRDDIANNPLVVTLEPTQSSTSEGPMVMSTGI